ncbi:MAG: hemagglutinin, partial [Gammaproteobacteria bacterium]|nr:hemagglutinin [Gammaproteobacteria bacterium]
DGLYEQRLLREAWTARTGQRFIAGIHSDEAIYRYLMDNAIASKDALSLSVGISLSAEQVAALTHDIVWMEEREVLGEKVLTPVLYLAQTEGRLAPSGALIQGGDLTLVSGGDLNNQGTLRASNNLSAQAQTIHNSGLIHAGERLSLLAENSIYNRQGGILAGRDVDLTARTGDILNERTVTRHASALGNSRWESSFADSAARIDATRDLTLKAGRDVHNLGSVLESRGGLHINAGRDVTLASVEEHHGNSHGSHYLNSQTTQLSSETRADGNLSIQAGRDLTAIASRVQSGKDMQLIAGNDLTLAAAANESHHYSKSKKRTSQRDQVRQVDTEVNSGGQFTAVAGQDLTLVSSSVVANDEAYLVAGGKVQLLAEQDYDYSFSEKKKKGSFGRKNYRMSESDNSTAVVSSIQAGIDLLMHGAEAIVSQGAQLQAEHHLELQSDGDILLLAAENNNRHASAKSKSGLLSSKGKTSSQSQTQIVGTTVDAGSILIVAGQDLRVNAGDLRAQGDMALQAERDV